MCEANPSLGVSTDDSRGQHLLLLGSYTLTNTESSLYSCENGQTQHTSDAKMNQQGLSVIEDGIYNMTATMDIV